MNHLFFATVSLIVSLLMIHITVAQEVTVTSAGEKVIEKPVSKHRTQVMVLGTFHFNQAEPAGEMLSERRQKEIAELLDLLEEFNPDKIFIERNPEFEHVNKIAQRFEKHMQGELKLSANEIYQIAFRLGKRLGHKELFQADHPGLYGMFNRKVRAYAEKNGQTDILEGKAVATTRGLYATRDIDKLFQNQTVVEHLCFLNSEEYEKADHGWYISTLPRIGDSNPMASEDEENDDEDAYFVGAEMLTDWYRRNIMIYSKVLTQMDFKEERILVVFGAGHSSTLKHLFRSNPHIELVDTHTWLSQRKRDTPRKIGN